MTVPSTERPLRVVLAGGGTAGHISPMLSIARALQEPQPGADGTVPVPAVCTMVGTESGMETRLVPDAGFELDTIGRVPFPRRPSTDVLRFPGRFRAAIDQAKAILRRREADVVVGVGGYVSTPMYQAAKSLGIPTVVHEANARPGLANRWGARSAARVAVALKGTPLKGSEWVGMPMRQEVSSLDRAEARGAAAAELGLDPERTTVIVTGGSSGAMAINRTIQGIVPGIAEQGYQLLHITGRDKPVLTPDLRPLEAEGYRQVEYVDGMEDVYAAADLLIARAGAATVSEVAAVGLPAIFVPLPIGNGEQALNARSLVEAGAARLVEDSDFTSEWYRANVLPLLTAPEGLAEMTRAARGAGVRDADATMAELILQEARREH